MNIENLATFHKHSFGSQIALGIEGENPLEIFNLFWNWGATNGEPVQETPKFLWFWTQSEKLEHALVLIMINRLLNEGKGKKGKKKGVLKEAVKKAKEFFNQIQNEEFVPKAEFVYRYAFGLNEGRLIDVNKTDCERA
jgi:hypothetical protein